VAGIIAADPVTGIGFHGIAPGATILPVRVTDRETDNTGATELVDPAILARGIRYAVDSGAKVINLSMAGDQDQKPVRQAIAYAVHKDVVVVAAAGNRQSADSGTLPSYPASYAGVIGVGSIDISGARASNSQVGPYVDLVAPGDGVLITTRRTGHMYASGTSFAAPFVSATAALVRSAWPKLTAPQVIARLRATAAPARGGTGSQEYGAGIVDPYRAVTEGLAGAAVKVPKATIPVPDQRLLAQRAWWYDADTNARRLTTLAIGTALALALVGGLLAAGRRRRWSAGRSALVRRAAPRDGADPLPEHLFGRDF
jgi:type VII secretion-associated serine protease mycosin